MITFRTLNSVYHIDPDKMTWTREPSERSGPLFADTGPLAQLPEVVVGQRCILVEGAGGVHEIIYTSTVTSID